jgi:hypothetical protein
VSAPVLSLELDPRPLHRVTADVIVTPYFAGEPPARGPFSWVDWRLCGLLSRELTAAGVAGRPGDAVLAPTGGRLRAGWVLALGLGPRNECDAARVRDFGRDAARRIAALHCGLGALALPAPGPALPAERVSAALAEGLATELWERKGTLRLRLIAPSADAHAAWAGLQRFAQRVEPEALVLRLHAPEDPRKEPVAPAAAPPSALVSSQSP